MISVKDEDGKCIALLGISVPDPREDYRAVANAVTEAIINATKEKANA